MTEVKRPTVDAVYAVIEVHSINGLDWIAKEELTELREHISRAIDNLDGVDALLDWFWNHDLMDCRSFEVEEHGWKKALAVLRVDLESTLGLECSALTPKIRALEWPAATPVTKPTKRARTEKEDSDTESNE